MSTPSPLRRLRRLRRWRPLLLLLVAAASAPLNTAAEPPCADPTGADPNNDGCQCGNAVCDAANSGVYCTAAESRCSQGPTCANTVGTAVNPGVVCKCGTVDCDGTTKYPPNVAYDVSSHKDEVTGMFCIESENRCAIGPACPSDWALFADDARLQGRPAPGNAAGAAALEDGVNYLTHSCTIDTGGSTKVTIGNGQALKLAKSPDLALLQTEIILDRRGGHRYDNSKQVFYMVADEALLELTGLTFTGGNNIGNGVGGVIQMGRTSVARITKCIFVNNNGQSGGVFYLSGTPTLTCHACLFYHNLARMWGSGGTGGVLQIDGGTATFEDSTFKRNKAITGANGLVPYGPVVKLNNGAVIMYRSTILDNAGRSPIHIRTQAPTNCLTLINMEEVQSSLVEEATTYPASCMSAPNVCKDNGFWDPCGPGKTAADITCSTALGIDTVSCNESETNSPSSGATRQATDCATTGTLRLSLGLVSGHLMGTPAKVLVGSSAECTITGASETQVNCTVAASDVWGTSGTTEIYSGSTTSSNAEGHLVQIIDVDGNSTFLEGQSPPPRLLFSAPGVLSIASRISNSSSSGSLADVAGGEQFIVTGSGFGPHDTSATPVQILIGGEPATQITWIGDSEITFVSPALAHNSQGRDPGFVLTAAGVRYGSVWNAGELELGTGGQTWERQASPPLLFSYAPPTLARVDSLKQVREANATGIPMKLHGTGFADVNLTHGNVRIWTQKAATTAGGAAQQQQQQQQNQITCGSIVRVSNEMLTCLYPDGGGAGCTDRNIFVSVAGQSTASVVRLCYLANGEVILREIGKTAPISRVSMVEGSASEYRYDIVLSAAPEVDNTGGIVSLTIASDADECSVHVLNPGSSGNNDTMMFSRASWATPQSVSLRIAEDSVDQVDTHGNLFAACTITHTVSSTNPVYNESATGPALVVDIIDDDVADSKIRPTTIRSTSARNNINAGQQPDARIKIENYHLKFLGPLTMLEGGSDYFGVQLDTRPTADVMLRLDVAKPREDTPASVSVTPNEFVFHPAAWNASQIFMARVAVAQDDVDSVLDLEDFTLTYSVSTSDPVYAQKATNLTIKVRVQDDDTAGVLFYVPTATTTLELTEGDAVGSVLTIRGLSSRPLADVTLEISSSLTASSLIHFDRRFIHVPASEWNKVDTNVTVRALEGDYGGKTTGTIFVTPRSHGDSKYNNSAARGELSVAIALQACGAGQIEATALVNISDSNFSSERKKCQNCPAGMFKGTFDVTCRPCIPGRVVARGGLAACSDCIPGKFQPLHGETSCRFCEKGRFQAQSGRATCDPSGVGVFVPPSAASGGNGGGVEEKLIRLGYHAVGCNSSGQFCTGEDPCPAGSKGTVPATHQCVLCPPGKHSLGGVTTCAACELGKFAAQEGTTQCIDCNVSLRLYADVKNSAECKACGADEVSTGKECRPVSEDLRLQVPVEVKIRLVDRTNHNKQEASNTTTLSLIEVSWQLTAGEQGSDAPASYIVMLSPDSDFSASDRSTFSNLNGPIARLPVLRAMASSLTTVIIYAKVRSVGPPSDIGMVSPWSGSSLPWQTADACSDSEYLSAAATNPRAWRCELCPRGASCDGPITWAGVKPRFGHARCPADPTLFETCSFPAACLGGANKALEGKYIQPDRSDPAVCNTSTACPESCNTGYLPGSLLCGACDEGYSHADLSGKCDKCPDAGENVGIVVAGILVGALGVVAFVLLTLGDAGKVDAAAGVKTIFLSFVQMMTLLTTFPIQWPAIFQSIFQVGGTVTVLGEHLVNLKCLVPSYSDADVFFAKAGAWAVMPVVLVGICLAVWGCVARVKDVARLGLKRWASCVALCYLLYPTLCAQAFNIFACRMVCDEEGVQRLRADLDEPCWAGRHAAMVGAVGVPMLAAYVFGLPLAALVLVRRLQWRTKAIWREGRRSRSESSSSTGRASQLSDWAIQQENNDGGRDDDDRAEEARQRGLRQHHRWFSEGESESLTEIHHARAMDGHFVWGMFYSSFREEMYWWEATVALRKAGLALIGVFGANLGLMQVHLTLLTLLAVLLVTAMLAPYGGQAAVLMYRLELLTLLATWLTLWAGSVFNTYPNCQDPMGKGGETLGWCDALSVIVGACDVVVVVVCVAAFVWAKKHMGQEDGGLKETKKNTKNTKKPQQAQSVELTVRRGGDESQSTANPAVGLEDEADVADEADEARQAKARHTQNHRKRHHSRDETRMPEGWDKHFTEDGTRYYAERASGLSSWKAPEGATGGSTGRPRVAEMAAAAAAATAVGGELRIGVGQVYGAMEDAARAIEYTDNPQQRSGSHHQRDSTQLPAGWDKHRDDDGNRYYYSRANGTSSWEVPAGARGGSSGR